MAVVALKGWLDEELPGAACPPEDAFAWGNKLVSWDKTDDCPWFEFDEDKAAASAASELAVTLALVADDADVEEEDDNDDGAELFVVVVEGVGDDCVVDGVDDGDVLKLPIDCWCCCCCCCCCCWRMFDGVGEDMVDEVDEDDAPPVVDLI